MSALALAVLLLYAPSWPMAVHAWGRPDYSHGPLVPFISLYLVWHMREQLRGLPASPSLVPGLLLLWLGILTLMLGRAGSVLIVELASVLIVVAGLVLCILGGRFLRALALPIGYLAFMVPLPDLFLNKIHWPFQIFMAKAAAWALPFADVPVFRRAQYLQLPNVLLNVTGGCSGIKYLVSIVAIAIPLAYVTQATRMKKALLIASAVLIGIAANIARITLVGVWAYYYDATSIHGPGHMLQGMFVAVAGYIFLFLIALYMLSGRRPPKNIRPSARGLAPIGTAKRVLSGDAIGAITVCVLSLLATSSFLLLQRPRSVPFVLHKDSLPQNIAGWQALNLAPGDQPFRVDGASVEVIRAYRRHDGASISLYLAYLDSQRQEGELVHYTFDDLYDVSREDSLDTAVGSVKVSTAAIRGFDRTTLFVYWYDLDGRTVANRYLVKVWTAVRSLLQGRSNGALILVRAESVSSQAGAETLEQMMDFCRHLHPLVHDLLARGTTGT